MRSNTRIALRTTAIVVLALVGAMVTYERVRGAQAQSPAPANPASEAGPTFTIPAQELHTPTTVIAYGDMRFTDPSNTTATDPTARKALIDSILGEKPDAILLNGDVPWHGGDVGDYAEYRAETQVWRDANLRIFPALGNHEFAQCELAQCLANWWATFPELKGRRWYSVRLGAKIYALAIDSDDSLLPGSDQQRWIAGQIASLPREIEFVLITMHHPPVADIQTKFNVDHNPRPNEIALAEFLKTAAAKSHAKFVVIAGHIHNYERFLQDGVVYLVSGGGGAVPYPVDRTPLDLYWDLAFPNYHYVKFVLDGSTLRATMFRLEWSAGTLDEQTTGTWDAKDHFEVHAR